MKHMMQGMDSLNGSGCDDNDNNGNNDDDSDEEGTVHSFGWRSAEGSSVEGRSCACSSLL